MVDAVPHGARTRVRALSLAALALVCGALAASPARAATPAPSAVTCSGHVDRGVDAAAPDQIDVAFGCSADIKSFTVISGAPIGLFAVSAEVFDHTTQAIVEADSFFCEGLIPGDGFNCTGYAHAGKDIKTTFETSDPVCSTTEATPRLKVQIVIADLNGATAGPFRLRGPEKCPKPKPAKPAGGKKHGRKHHHRHAARRGR
jgi:hypothetical protein